METSPTAGGFDGAEGPFWLDGTLRISADEQIAFLKRFYEGELGLSDRATTLTKNIMLADSTPRWRLSAKTGACRPAGEDATMWYVGYVERDSNVFYFALQLGAKEFGTLFEQRVRKRRRFWPIWESWIDTGTVPILSQSLLPTFHFHFPHSTNSSPSLAARVAGISFEQQPRSPLTSSSGRPGLW